MSGQAGSCYLYRLSDAGGGLLYVGISDDWTRRMIQHRRRKPWFDQVAATTIETHPDRTAALAAERVTIRAELPRYNVAHAARRPTDATTTQPISNPTGACVDSEPIPWECWRCEEQIEIDLAPSTGDLVPEFGWLRLYSGQRIRTKWGEAMLWAPVCASCAASDSAFAPVADIPIALVRTSRMFMREIAHLIDQHGPAIVTETALANLIGWQVACLQGRAS